METVLSDSNGTAAILEYISRELSWRKLYFRKFPTGQKVLFFLPLPFLWPVLYGTYDLFNRDSWLLFAITGILMLVSIRAFFKQRSVFERKVFEKHYQSETCKNMLDFQVEKLSSFLGEHNTAENRICWKECFKPNSSFVFICSIAGAIIGNGTVVVFWLFGKNCAREYCLITMSYIVLLMNLAFIMPAVTDFGFLGIRKKNEALKLISEIDRRLYEEEEYEWYDAESGDEGLCEEEEEYKWHGADNGNKPLYY
jgi:hypothetical protein